jgi:chromosome partitioning protein
MAAARVADLIIIPCRPQIYDLETIPNTRELVRLSGDRPTLAFLNAVPSQVTRQEQALDAIRGMQMEVCPVLVGNRSAFGDAAALGQTVLEFDPRGKAALEITEAYKYISRLVGLGTQDQAA